MSNEDDFWTELALGQAKAASPLDAYLQDKEEESISRGMRVLTDRGRAAAALPLPANVGMRVSFLVNIGSVMSYPDPPGENAEGTVVMVRTAEGDQTGMDDRVFVKWDDGKFLAMHHEHLRSAKKTNRKRASSFVRTALSLGDLTGFMHGGGEEDDLVHKATNDLWSFEQGNEGFVISRLFDESGDPLKG
jgi:hypothetical protein